MTDRSKLLALADEADRAYEWMREPDWAHSFTMDDLAKWLNDRPTHLLPKIAQELRAQAEALS